MQQLIYAFTDCFQMIYGICRCPVKENTDYTKQQQSVKQGKPVLLLKSPAFLILDKYNIQNDEHTPHL